MKRVISAICILAVMLATSATALAATIVAVPEPLRLESAGTVKVSFTITNDSEYEMRNISISGYSVIGSQEVTGLVIAPGQERTFHLPNVSVIEDMLGQSLPYTIAWTENGDHKSKSVSVAVEGPQEALEMTAKRSADKSSGKEGDKIILTYALTNPGEVEMTNISISDSGISKSPIATGLTLQPGSEPLVVTYEYTLGKEDAVSLPVITYRLNGAGKTLTFADKLTLKVLKVAKLEVEVVKSDATPEGVNFTLTLRNTGTQPIKGIRVTDELGGKVNEQAFNLGIGEEKALNSYPVPNPSEPRNVIFTVSGEDEQGQLTSLAKTESYEVRPYVDPSHVSLSLTATAKQALSDSGRMQVRFAIQNNSNVEMTSAVISEEELGTLETTDILPLGETIVEKELLIGEPRELRFMLVASDPSGAQHTYQATLTAAHEVVATPAPTLEPVEEPQPSGVSNTLITVLIVLAGLMAVAGIALLALSIYERKRNAAMEADEEEEPHPRMGAQPRTNATNRRMGASERFARAEEKTIIEEETPVKTYKPASVQSDSSRYAPDGVQQSAARSSVVQQPDQIRFAQPQERVVPPVQQSSVPVQPERAVPVQQVRVTPPQQPQQPVVPQASPEIRNRVHRVRPKDEEK